MKKHFVTFFSPGTMFSEESTEEIDSWNVEEARKRADDIVERHNATPYGFQFVTRERGEDDFDSRETERSNMYYINCKVETLAEIEERNDPDESILRSNMKVNGWDKVAVTTKGWKSTHPLRKNDIVLYEI